MTSATARLSCSLGQRRALAGGVERLAGELAAGQSWQRTLPARVADAGQAEDAAERDERRRDADADVERAVRRGLHRSSRPRAPALRGIDARERLRGAPRSIVAALARARAPGPSRRSSSAEPNCAETTAPMAATASSPATRAIALLMPDAMPAFDSSASASTVAVSGATVSESPSEKSSSAGRRSVK